MSQNEAQYFAKAAIAAQQGESGAIYPMQGGLGAAVGSLEQATNIRAEYEAERKAEKRFQIRASALEAAIRSLAGTCASAKDTSDAAEIFVAFLSKDTP